MVGRGRMYRVVPGGKAGGRLSPPFHNLMLQPGEDEHAAVRLGMANQAAVRCLWRGRPDLPKGLKLSAATPILAEIEHGPRR